MQSVAVHPGGKILLSVGKDATFRIWDLVAAKCAFTTKLPSGLFGRIAFMIIILPGILPD